MNPKTHCNCEKCGLGLQCLLMSTDVSCRLLHDDQKDSGLLPVLSRMLKNFNFRHQPRSCAAEIVEALHVTLRLLERLSRQGGQIIGL